MEAKRLFAILLVLAVLSPFPASRAADTAAVTMDTVSAAQGDTVTVGITLQNNPGLAGLRLSVYYNMEFLTLLGTETDSRTLSSLSFIPGPSDAQPFILAWFGASDDFSNGILVTLCFAVSSNAPPDTYPIRVECDPANTMNQSFAPVAIVTIDGGLTVVRGELPGTITDPEPEETPAEENGEPKPGDMPAENDDEEESGSNDGGSELPSPAGTRISQPASSLTLVPYYIADGKEILIKMSGIQDGKLVFTSPAKALYQYKDNAKTFADVPQGFWGTDAIRFVTAREIFNGLGDSIFSPDTGMTRAMFTRVLANIEGINTDSYKTSAFDDVDINAWYSGTVAWAAEMGIVNGIGNGLFAPDQEITREQMAVMLYNYMQWKGIELSGSTPEAFSDAGGISTWATDAVMEMRRAGIINGVGDNRYDPKGTATRAQVATIFMNFVNAVAVG